MDKRTVRDLLLEWGVLSENEDVMPDKDCWDGKCKVKVPVEHAKDVDYQDKDDDYLYHATTHKNAQRIKEHGFDFHAPKTFQGGFHQAHSHNKVFFSERSSAKEWQDKVDQHLEYAYDRPPKSVVIRVHKKHLPNLQSDEPGTRDMQGSKAYYLKHPELESFRKIRMSKENGQKNG